MLTASHHVCHDYVSLAYISPRLCSLAFYADDSVGKRVGRRRVCDNIDGAGMEREYEKIFLTLLALEKELR